MHNLLVLYLFPEALVLPKRVVKCNIIIYCIYLEDCQEFYPSLANIFVLLRISNYTNKCCLSRSKHVNHHIHLIHARKRYPGTSYKWAWFNFSPMSDVMPSGRKKTMAAVQCNNIYFLLSFQSNWITYQTRTKYKQESFAMIKNKYYCTCYWICIFQRKWWASLFCVVHLHSIDNNLKDWISN